MKTVSYFLILGLFFTAAEAAETRMLAGTVTNTTHGVAAPAEWELVLAENGAITGWITVKEPLAAGRWPVTGTLKGAWCEVTYHPTPETTVQLRGALSATEFRGTYVFGGGGKRVQYGRFLGKVR